METRNEEFRDLSADIKIDRFSLEQNSQEQPMLMWAWGEKLAEAKTARDKKKNQLEFIEAETNLNLRKSPPKDLKVTVDVAASMVETDPDVVKAKAELAEAESVVFHLEAAIRALEHRKSEIDNLTKLWIAGYYADPNRSRKIDDMEAEERRALKRKSTQGVTNEEQQA